MTTELQAAAAEIEHKNEPDAPSSDEVEKALDQTLYDFGDGEERYLIKEDDWKTLRAHIAALEADNKRKKAWLNRAESELEKIELIKSTGLSFKGEMQYYVNLALLAVQAALAQTDGKAGE